MSVLVKFEDLGCLGYCSRGSRAFFKSHNLDWFDFLHNGIDSEKLLATKDSMAEKVVAAAVVRIGDQNG